jgi:hypothetical protein
MHDSQTQAFVIPFPWFTRHRLKTFSYRYWHPFITVWHVDPEKDGTDDSCGWFMRSRHGDQAVLEKIIKRFDEDWDRVFESRKEDSTGEPIGPVEKVYYCGYFYPENAGAGMPNMSVTAIALNLFFLAACVHFNKDGRTNWKKPRRWMQRRLFDIMLFAENPTDSLRDDIVRKWGTSTNRKERIERMASCIYAWILREERPWWKHPRWHIWHWKLQIHPWQKLKRWAFERCAYCGRGFKWGEVVTGNWGGTKIWHCRYDNSAKPSKQP